MNFTGNWFDITFIAIILITSVLAFLRGFIKDFASFLNWLLAISLTYVLSPHIAKLFDKAHYSPVVIDFAVSTILFILLLIIISIITSKISKSLADKTARSIDGSLGFAFGFVKGYFLVALFFSIIVTIYAWGFIPNLSEEAPKKFKGREGPEWLTHAQSYKILEIGSDILRPVTNIIMRSVVSTGLIEDGKEKIKSKIKDKINKKLDAIENSDIDDERFEKGYNSKEIQKMNRLIEIIDKQN
jgi:uncharacterized membrane protein required for colicin V production